MDRLVWIDCEMTGLDPASDVLLEVACLVTDGELNVVGDGTDLVIAAPEAALDAMVPVVKDMHETSGLTAAVRASTLSVAEAERQILAYVRSLVPENRRAPLCGNSIATDRSFLARYMPELDGYLHYRMIDVSSVKELARRWYPRAYYAAPVKHGGHRALADIRESIEELRYYRRTVFVPQPGPTTDEARAASVEIRAETDAAAQPASSGSGAADQPSLDPATAEITDTTQPAPNV
ncbi:MULTISPECIES: oligoribonuclease [unclassified Pseudofrankia]|uniref:oligoribonuclease n=1 Tax=unclassified Pseudofrankia TaxID=2994372 RepID=UPI0008D91635|nr:MULTISPECIES: oligoribonuclease [unclassified Pseudofrankia]MDT3440564.1 oligoribonuclease [Pseudofrankia sp. BMG5.37]OHV47784.1 oligoribonuclease [Pseudofrankia sp. BMG5.36]